MALGFDTATNVLNQAAKELGLISATVSDPYASTDPNMVQLCALLTSAGQEILREHHWSQSIKEHTFTTSAGDYQYDLPADFMRMIDQSGWNRSTSYPLGSPLSSQAWQYMEGSSSGPTITVYFRIQQREIRLQPTTDMPANYTIAFEYMSRYWVQASGQSSGNKEAPTASTDTLLYDRLLMVRALVLAFLKRKGFDTTAAQDDYNRTLRSIMSDEPAPVLSLTGNSGVVHFLDLSNVPDTGIGS